MNEVKREIEPWQQEDAARLLAIFLEKKAAAKRLGVEKLTQEILAEKAGITSSQMAWQYLHGRRALNFKAAAGFAMALGVRVQDFSPQLAGQIASVAPGLAPTLASSEDSSGGYSLSVEKLLLINAINEREAAILRGYRMANEVGARMVETAARTAPKRGFGVVGGDNSEQDPARAG